MHLEWFQEKASSVPDGNSVTVLTRRWPSEGEPTAAGAQWRGRWPRRWFPCAECGSRIRSRVVSRSVEVERALFVQASTPAVLVADSWSCNPARDGWGAGLGAEGAALGGRTLFGGPQGDLRSGIGDQGSRQHGRGGGRRGGAVQLRQRGTGNPHPLHALQNSDTSGRGGLGQHRH